MAQLSVLSSHLNGAIIVYDIILNGAFDQRALLVSLFGAKEGEIVKLNETYL